MKCAALFKLAAASVALALGGPGHAQTYPSRPVKLVVPFAPGGLPDTVARILAANLQSAMGQPFVVENKAGASGSLAGAVIVQSPADGYTFLITDGPSLVIAPLLVGKLSYDSGKDFVPVSLVGTAPLFLAAHPSVKANTIDQLVALAKSKPGSLNYGSSGNGSIHHLTAEAMKAGFGANITHIPFKGSGASVPAMVGGQVDLVFASPPSLMGFVKAGQAKLLAINSAKRSPLAPDVPALAEKLPGFDYAFTVPVLAKTGTPREIIDKVSGEIAKIVQRPEIAEQLRTAGVEPVGGTPEQLAKALQAEAMRITAAAKHTNLKPE